jgi:hypothetical protein
VLHCIKLNITTIYNLHLLPTHYKVMCCFMIWTSSEKYATRQFHHCKNIIQYTYTNLDYIGSSVEVASFSLFLRWKSCGSGTLGLKQYSHESGTTNICHHGQAWVGFFFFLILIVLLFIRAYNAWVISPSCPHPLPPTHSIPGRNYFALISNFVEERV